MTFQVIYFYISPGGGFLSLFIKMTPVDSYGTYGGLYFHAMDLWNKHTIFIKIQNNNEMTHRCTYTEVV